jgi:hypothetical protein
VFGHGRVRCIAPHTHTYHVDQSGGHSISIVSLGEVALDLVCAYDRTVFPAERRAFLEQWIHLSDSTSNSTRLSYSLVCTSCLASLRNRNVHPKVSTASPYSITIQHHHTASPYSITIQHHHTASPDTKLCALLENAPQVHTPSILSIYYLERRPTTRFSFLLSFLFSFSLLNSGILNFGICAVWATHTLAFYFTSRCAIVTRQVLRALARTTVV